MFYKIILYFTFLNIFLSSHSKVNPPQFSKGHTRVYFYDRKSHPENFEFSNFYPRDAWYKGTFYKTAEHAYQAQKFNYTPIDPSLIAEVNRAYYHVVSAPTPRLASELADKYRNFAVPSWHKADETGNKLKDKVMFEILKDKFTRHKDLQNKLLETEDARLVEDSKIDSYWGRGLDGKGKNQLGRLLMKIRKDIRNGNY